MLLVGKGAASVLCLGLLQKGCQSEPKTGSFLAILLTFAGRRCAEKCSGQAIVSHGAQMLG